MSEGLAGRRSKVSHVAKDGVAQALVAESLCSKYECTDGACNHIPSRQRARRRKNDTTVPPIKGSFEDTVKAMLKPPPAPKNLGRPKAKKKGAVLAGNGKEKRTPHHFAGAVVVFASTSFRLTRADARDASARWDGSTNRGRIESGWICDRRSAGARRDHGSDVR